MKTIVCISGKMKSGKDEVARVLTKYYGYKKIFFAERLKKAACAIFGWTMEELEDQSFKEGLDPYWGYVRRQVLQVFGTQVMRQFFPKAMQRFTKKDNPLKTNVWVKGVAQDLQNSSETMFVSTDLRFPNEFQFFYDLKKNDEYDIVLVRIEPSYKKFPMKVSKNPILRFFQLLIQKQHESEYMLDMEDRWDVVLENNSTLDDFHKKIQNFIIEEKLTREGRSQWKKSK